jgi:hypothetical protein
MKNIKFTNVEIENLKDILDSNVKNIKFTNVEIENLKDILDSYISYMIASGASEDYILVRECESLIEKLEKGE